MKVLFVSPPYHAGVVEVAGRWIPLQYVYMAGTLRAAGHEVVIYDAMSKWHDHEQIKQRIAAERPDVIAITAITPTYPDSVELLRNAKALLPGVVTVMGGVHPHFMYREVFENDGDAVDYIARGEGEHTIVELVDALASKDKARIRDVRSIVYNDGNEIVVTPGRIWHRDLDSLPKAFDLLDWEDYKYFVIKKSRLGAIDTSRGCPHGCTFCSQQKFWQQSWRARDPYKVVQELIDLRKHHGVNVALLTDEYPTADRERWEKILDLLIESQLGTYLLMETRVEDILRDEDILWKYRKAGVVHVYMGAEATEQATLDMMKKDIKVEWSRQALKLVTDHGMVTETSMVLGFPDETPETIERTLGLATHFNPDNAHFLAIAPWPYADMYKDLEPHIEVWDYRKYNLIDPIVKPKAMTLDDLDHYMIDCYRRFYMGKLRDFVEEPDPFRRYYLVQAARLIMNSSFIKNKMMKGAGMPKEVRKFLRALGA